MCVNTISFVNGEYKAFFDVKEIKEYAKECLNRIIDERWFNKTYSVENG